MTQSPAPVQLLVELESRQDEVLQLLDDLERRIETALTDFAAVRQAACKPRRGEQPAQAA